MISIQGIADLELLRESVDLAELTAAWEVANARPIRQHRIPGFDVGGLRVPWVFRVQ